ncbi:MAG TPA: hypothetical protein VNY27_05815 [Solirubrobacteraceae bacterium]|nr:hypothetical protein [Solirubrobacteraceae bacterium]
MQSRRWFVPVRRLLARSTRREGLDWDLYSRVDRGHGDTAPALNEC